MRRWIPYWRQSSARVSSPFSKSLMNFILSVMVLVSSQGIKNIFYKNVLLPRNVFTMSPVYSVHYVPG